MSIILIVFLSFISYSTHLFYTYPAKNPAPIGNALFFIPFSPYFSGFPTASVHVIPLVIYFEFKSKNYYILDTLFITTNLNSGP